MQEMIDEICDWEFYILRFYLKSKAQDYYRSQPSFSRPNGHFFYKRTALRLSLVS